MRSRVLVMTGGAALALAALGAGVALLPAASTAPTAPTASASAVSGWWARTSVRPGNHVFSVIVNPQATAAYALSSGTRATGPFRLRRLGLTSRTVASGPAFPVSGLSYAGGYLWVSGGVPAGPRSSSFRLVLYQVSPVTLRTIRSWRLTGELSASLDNVPVTTGPAGTVWAGFQRTLWRLSTRTGAVVRRAQLPAGQSVSDVATDPARAHLYVSAAPRLGGGVLHEYAAATGRALASTSNSPLRFSVSGAALTAVRAGVWASYRTGMAGQTILLRQRGLGNVRLTGGRTLFSWFMGGSTGYGGGSVWVGLNNGDIGCVAPGTGAVRSRGVLRRMADGGQVLGVSAARHVIYALGPSSILAVTAPAICWR